MTLIFPSYIKKKSSLLSLIWAHVKTIAMHIPNQRFMYHSLVLQIAGLTIFALSR